MARWGVFVDADNPVDAADIAHAIVTNAQSRHWIVTNLDTGDTTVVDLTKRVEVPQGCSNIMQPS